MDSEKLYELFFKFVRSIDIGKTNLISNDVILTYIVR